MNKLFLVVGASAVGKTTVVKKVCSDYDLFKSYDLDFEISKRFGNKDEEVVNYFQRVGINEFQENAFTIIEEVSRVHINDDKIILFDIGAGATYAFKSVELAELYPTVLLTANPKYLWDNRKKARENHNNFNHYKMWQFNLQTMLHDACEIKIDVAYLDIIQVAESLKNKILNYSNK